MEIFFCQLCVTWTTITNPIGESILDLPNGLNHLLCKLGGARTGARARATPSLSPFGKSKLDSPIVRKQTNKKHLFESVCVIILSYPLYCIVYTGIPFSSSQLTQYQFAQRHCVFGYPKQNPIVSVGSVLKYPPPSPGHEDTLSIELKTL
jgi:hypothetical protein